MTSQLKIEANRRNAKRSSGPKSTAGRRQASRNARRHGLNVSISADQFLSEQARDLAQNIAGGSNLPEVLELAGRVAEAQVDLVRVRKVKDGLLEMLFTALDGAQAPELGVGNKPQLFASPGS